MKFAVLGAGLMGQAVTYDLLKQNNVDLVIITDSNKDQLDKAVKNIKDSRLKPIVFNAENSDEIENIFNQVNAAVCAIHYKFNEKFTQIAIKTKTHMCDLGGNNSVVDEQLSLDDKARNAGISIIPDCGLAPGFVAILTKWGIENLTWVDSVKIRVGGLPQNPKGILNYERLFSTDGLINEYVEPVRVLHDGKLLEVEPLIDIEEIEFPKPYNKMEAFNTSGGISTLVETYKNKLKNLDYKTIRYPGHGKIMRAFYELGFFSDKNREFTKILFEKHIPICTNDVTLVKIIFTGVSNRHELTIIDKARPPHTSMMRMTAYPAAIISYMQAGSIIKDYGVKPQELCVPVNEFISELTKRDIIIQGVSDKELTTSYSLKK